MTTGAESKLGRIALIATVALIGLNLRPFITSIGPLAAGIQDSTALSLQGLALLTLIPMLLMGAVAFAGPAVQSLVGARRAMIGSLGVICIGIALRWLASTGWLMVVTAAIIGLGVAIVQAVFPGIVKREFPHHVGPMMGLYSATLMGGGALGAVVSPVVAHVTGSWELGLACFALPALAAVILAGVFLPGDASTRQVGNITRILLSRPRTWLLMICFGLVNGGYSSVVAWIAPAYQEYGWGASASGSLLAILSISQAVTALTLPILARKMPDRRPWLWLTLVMQAVGFAGLAFLPVLAPFTLSIILGAGLGGFFAMIMIVALDHLPDPAQAGALSALMQGGGFILAAVPAWLVAALHDATGGYAAGWLWHLGCVIIVIALVIRFTPGGYARVMPEVGGGLNFAATAPCPHS